jgi:hypothetical protein
MDRFVNAVGNQILVETQKNVRGKGCAVILTHFFPIEPQQTGPIKIGATHLLLQRNRTKPIGRTKGCVIIVQ